MEQQGLLCDQNEQIARAICSLEGLSIGDAFGEQFFHQPDLTANRIASRTPPSPPWSYTDDTQMALSIVSMLRQYGTIEQDRLAESFAERYDPSRGYGPSMHRLLRSIRAGNSWSIAVAVAAAIAWRLRHASVPPSRAEFLDLIVPLVPTSEVRRKIRWARDLSTTASIEAVVDLLGNGTGLSAQDTVPFVLWCAGEHLDDYEQALWLTASGFGDVDTTCAMVGGIVALYSGVEGIPITWRQAREPLPNWPFVGAYRPPDDMDE